MFPIIAVLIAFASAGLLVWPVWTHPTLPVKQKRFFAAFVIIITVLFGLALYAWIGVPQMAVF